MPRHLPAIRGERQMQLSNFLQLDRNRFTRAQSSIYRCVFLQGTFSQGRCSQRRPKLFARATCSRAKQLSSAKHNRSLLRIG